MNNSMWVKLENVKKLIRRNAKGPLYKLLSKLHPADIAYILENLSDIDRKRLWAFLNDNSRIAQTLLELDESTMINLISGMEPQKVGHVLMEMESDDVSYVLRVLPDDIKEKVLHYITGTELSDVEELLHYPEKTAGAMMNTEYIAFPEDTTVKAATKSIHQAQDIEMIYYLYVVDAENRLTGVLSLRQLILNPPEKTLGEIMTRDVITVQDITDQQAVANMVERYDFLALPVVDDQRRIVGIITFDDVIDVIREEAAEDIHKLTGTPLDFSGDESVAKSARKRLPWLIITLVGEMLSGVVIAFYQGRVADFLVLASFMPVIMAMGGNVGSQSSTIIIRNIATGRVDHTHIIPILWKELRVGLLMGILSGIPITFLAPLVHGTATTGIVVGVALFCAMSFAAFTGTLVPLILIKMKVDPAVASGPFISTFNDITGLTIYFSVAMLLLSIL